MTHKANHRRETEAHAPEPLPSDPVIEAYKKDVDRTLLRENLKLTIEQRLENLEFLIVFAEEFATRIEALFGLPHRPLGDPSF